MGRLVVTRKLNETIRIGDNIFVTVVLLDRNKVRIAIEAPGTVKILREELARRREAETNATEPPAA